MRLKELRSSRGVSQLKLAIDLNMNQNSISRYENMEREADYETLIKFADYFDVSVDYLLSSHDEWKPPESFAEDERNFHSKVITAVVIAGIWTLAFLIYIIGWLLEANWWLIFIYAVPVSLITLLVLNSVWERGKHNRHIIYALVASVFITVYLTFRSYNPWQILLLLIPGELIVFLSFRIKKSHK